MLWNSKPMEPMDRVVDAGMTNTKDPGVARCGPKFRGSCTTGYDCWYVQWRLYISWLYTNLCIYICIIPYLFLYLYLYLFLYLYLNYIILYYIILYLYLDLYYIYMRWWFSALKLGLLETRWSVILPRAPCRCGDELERILAWTWRRLNDQQRYPLVNIQKSSENCHWNSGSSHEEWWFSTVFCMFTRGYWYIFFYCDLLSVCACR